jgi:hypothetical protein
MRGKHASLRRGWASLLGLFLIALGSSPAAATPTGDVRWAVVLCKFADNDILPLTNGEPYPMDWLRKFFTEEGIGAGGMYDYWAEASLGQIKFKATLFGWYKMPPSDVLANYTTRTAFWNDCVTVAKSQGANLSGYYGVITVKNADSPDDSALHTGPPGAVVFNPSNLYVSFVGHETGHGHGFDHSYDTNKGQCSGTPSGEYGDNYDIMSWHCGVKAYPGAFGTTGPRINAAYLDIVGWMPANRVFAYNPAGPAVEITLAPLGTSSVPGFLVAQIPMGTDPNHYYTVEYRRNRQRDPGGNDVPSGLDQGMNDKIVLIHEVRQEQHGSEVLRYHPFIVDSTPSTGFPLNPEWTTGPNPTFVDSATNVHVTVISTGDSARVDIGHANDVPGPYPAPPVPANLQEGLSGISTNGLPGFIDIAWDDSSSTVETFNIDVTGPFASFGDSTIELETPGFQRTVQFSAEQVVAGSSWQFAVRACVHGAVCSDWSAPLTVTNPTGGGGGGGGGGGAGQGGGRSCGGPGRQPCGSPRCGGMNNPCPLPSNQ